MKNPCAMPSKLGFENRISSPKQTPMTPIREMTSASTSRKPFCCRKQNQQNVQRGQAHAPQQRNVKQQVQRDGRTDDLGQVAGGNRDLGADPEHERYRTAEVVATGGARSRPVTTPSLMARVCSRMAIRLESRMTEEQRVIVFRAAGQIGRPVARIHVADGHQVTRARRKPGACAESRPTAEWAGCGKSPAGWGGRRRAASLCVSGWFPGWG